MERFGVVSKWAKSVVCTWFVNAPLKLKADANGIADRMNEKILLVDNIEKLEMVEFLGCGTFAPTRTFLFQYLIFFKIFFEQNFHNPFNISWCVSFQLRHRLSKDIFFEKLKNFNFFFSFQASISET